MYELKAICFFIHIFGFFVVMIKKKKKKHDQKKQSFGKEMVRDMTVGDDVCFCFAMLCFAVARDG